MQTTAAMLFSFLFIAWSYILVDDRYGFHISMKHILASEYGLFIRETLVLEIDRFTPNQRLLFLMQSRL